MTNKIEILYPMRKDFFENSKENIPEIFFHFCYYGKQVVIQKVRSQYRVLTMSYFPVEQKYIDYRKDWNVAFECNDLSIAIFKFQSICKRLVVDMNNEYLSRVFVNPNTIKRKEEVLENDLFTSI